MIIINRKNITVMPFIIKIIEDVVGEHLADKGDLVFDSDNWQIEFQHDNIVMLTNFMPQKLLEHIGNTVLWRLSKAEYKVQNVKIL